VAAAGGDALVPFTSPPVAPDPVKGPFSFSAYVPDAVISPHPRFGTLVANIRSRRGRKVNIQVPLLVPTTGSDGGGKAAAVAAADAAERLAEALAASAVAADGAGAGEPLRDTVATAFARHAALQRAEKQAAAAAAAAAETGAACDVSASAVGPRYVPVSSHVHMDAMAFGMGCCCLQVTFQARDLPESRLLYDQLGILAPIMLALTANAPIWRGRLTDMDTRWHVIAASVDCRTPAERGDRDAQGIQNGPGSDTQPGQLTPEAAPVPAEGPCWTSDPRASGAAGSGKRPLMKSRYSSIDMFIGTSPAMRESYNDLPLQFDAPSFARLAEEGVDSRLARHIAHLFTRDPLVIYKERVQLDDARFTDHFENLQSTNWRSMRWKPPPPDAPGMGWRVELRTMEAQLTDFENAAFTVFVVLLSRVILSFDLDLYLPLSLVDANLERAKAKDAVLRERFFFRRNVAPHTSLHPNAADAGARAAEARTQTPSQEQQETPEEPVPCIVEEMSLREILLGRDEPSTKDVPLSLAASAPSSAAAAAAFPGLIPLIFAYLDAIQCDQETRDMVDHYLRFIAARATGEAMTGAAWQRNFVLRHPEYRGDGIVTQAIAFDLLQAIERVTTGQAVAPDLLGPLAPPVLAVSTQNFPSPCAVFGAETIGHMLDAAVRAEHIPAPAAAGASVRELPMPCALAEMLDRPHSQSLLCCSGTSPSAAAEASGDSSTPPRRRRSGSTNLVAVLSTTANPGATVAAADEGASASELTGGSPGQQRTRSGSGGVAAELSATSVTSGKAGVCTLPPSLPTPLTSGDATAAGAAQAVFPAYPSPGVRMRGRSFAEEVMAASGDRPLIRMLLQKYTVSVADGVKFEDVPSFLPPI
jgi:glutamate--cysteine ligase catalytic subunit